MVRVIGVDEHRWSHTRRTGDDGYLTVIIDLAPVLEDRGGVAARPGSSLAADQSPQCRDQVQRDLGDAGQRQNSGSAVLVLLGPIGCTISLHKTSGH